MSLSNEDKEYIKSLGLLNARSLLSESGRHSGRSDMRDGREDSFSSIITRNTFSVEVDEVDDKIIDRFSTSMTSKIQPVRITGAIRDLINPMFDRMSILNEVSEQQEKQRHIETSLYNSRILSSMNEMNAGMRGVERGFYLSMKEFANAPALVAMSKTVGALQSTLKVTSGILFGFGKKEKSDSEKIVDAIKEQTEWHMTGGIKQMDGFFKRLGQHGIVGLGIEGIARRAMNVVGINRRRAQEAEDRQSLGQDRGGVLNTISRYLIGHQVTRRGRLSPAELEEQRREKEMHTASLNASSSSIVSIEERTLPLAVHDKSTSTGIVNVTRMLRDSSEVADNNHYQSEMKMASGMGIIHNHLKVADKKGETQNAITNAANDGIVKWTKETREEVRKHRRQAFWTSIVNGIKDIATSLTKTALDIGKILAGLVGAGFFGRMLRRIPGTGGINRESLKRLRTGIGDTFRKGKAGAGDLFRKGKAGASSLFQRGKAGAMGIYGRADNLTKGNLSKYMARVNKSKLGRVTGIGALAGLGGYAAEEHISDPRLAAIVGMLADTLVSARTGAMVGSAVPGVGTVGGTIVGAAHGASTGFMKRKNALVGIKELESSEFPISRPKENHTNPYDRWKSGMGNIPQHPSVDYDTQAHYGQNFDHVIEAIKNSVGTTQSDLDELQLRYERETRLLLQGMTEQQIKSSESIENTINKAVENVIRATQSQMMPTPIFDRK